MGLFQNLLETYEKCSSAVGIQSVDASGNINEKKTLLPIFHMTFKSSVCVTIDGGGNFIGASRDNKESTIIIPCTEASSGRSNDKANPQPHPLCDQLDYIGGLKDKDCKNYLLQLAAWKGDSAVLGAIYDYVSGKTILYDLSEAGIFGENEYKAETGDDGRQLDGEKIRKLGVRFEVELDGGSVKAWESKDLREMWISHASGASGENQAFDYLSGEAIGRVAAQHPKNIYSMVGNAKLLSCNDTSGFTFRGRFAEQDDAVIVDYAKSQKMHQMLRWLIANYGYTASSQVIVTWAVDGDTLVKEKPMEDSFDLFADMKIVKTGEDILSEARLQIYDDYTVKFNNLLAGYGNANKLMRHQRRICVAAFDAATVGRMGLTFYIELSENAYIENIISWHIDTSYFLTSWKKGRDENEKGSSVHFIGAPSYDDILFALYGRPRGGNDAGYDTLRKKVRKQLLECMFGNFAFPKSMVETAANRASRPMSFTDSNGSFNEYDWKRSVSITCALARKYYKQQEEEIQLELETMRTDRDYLFGRLLSVADRLERTAQYRAGKQDDRSTNATRLMSAFQVKPYATWGQLYSQLIPYKNQLGGADYYQSLIDEILTLFKSGEFEDNSPLSPLYLLGYSAQNRALSKYKNNREENENGGTDE